MPSDIPTILHTHTPKHATHYHRYIIIIIRLSLVCFIFFQVRCLCDCFVFYTLDSIEWNMNAHFISKNYISRSLKLSLAILRLNLFDFLSFFFSFNSISNCIFIIQQWMRFPLKWQTHQWNQIYGYNVVNDRRKKNGWSCNFKWNFVSNNILFVIRTWYNTI